MQNARHWARLGGICGVVGILIYFGLALADPWLPGGSARTTAEALAAYSTPQGRHGIMLAHFAVVLFALLWIVALWALEQVLTNKSTTTTDPITPVGNLAAARFGALFGSIAFGILTVMLIVQGTVMAEMGRMYGKATSDADRQSFVELYRGLRSIDLGLDLTWDVFITISFVLLGWAMLKAPGFGKTLGVSGMAIGGATLGMNVWAAPTPPSVDLGPLCGLWMLVVSVQMIRLSRQMNESEGHLHATHGPAGT